MRQNQTDCLLAAGQTLLPDLDLRCPYLWLCVLLPAEQAAANLLIFRLRKPVLSCLPNMGSVRLKQVSAETAVTVDKPADSAVYCIEAQHIAAAVAVHTVAAQIAGSENSAAVCIAGHRFAVLHTAAPEDSDPSLCRTAAQRSRAFLVFPAEQADQTAAAHRILAEHIAAAAAVRTVAAQTAGAVQPGPAAPAAFQHSAAVHRFVVLHTEQAYNQAN